MPSESTFLLAGLFMLAAALGWAYARYTDGRDGRDPPPNLSEGYIRGLNLLLDQQTDEALDLFLRMFSTGDDALDTHFALASLYRRRGEVDRAIRIHQNILARPSLTSSQRDQALYSLGLDYDKAGLLDRSEAVYRELQESPTHAQEALKGLVRIYEQGGEWEQAVEVQEELHALTGEDNAHVISHYYCELAERASRAGDAATARAYLKKTMRGRHRTIRGALARAAIATGAKDYATAMRLYEWVLKRDRSFVIEVLAVMVACARAQDRIDELDRLLARMSGGGEQFRRELAFAAILENITDLPSANAAVAAVLRAEPLLVALTSPQSAAKVDAASAEPLPETMRIGLRRLASSTPRYRCGHCGYATDRLTWQCPSCRSWDSQKPITELPVEAIFMKPRISGAGAANS